MKDINFNIISQLFIVIFHLIPVIFLGDSKKIIGKLSLTLFQFIWFSFGILSITCGYHRLFNHKSYQANPIVQLFFLIFGASSLQHSALNWSRDHRLHHRDQDKKSDPYNINLGFWHAHVLWLFKNNPDKNKEVKTINVDDLKKNKLVVLQDKFYVLFVIAGLVIPILAGLPLGFKLKELILSGVIRNLLIWHATWSVNSFAHLYGDRPYDNNISPVENFLVSVITFGEGWHNYHHSYPRDYRASHSDNNLKYFNPSSMFINLLCKLNLASKRQVTSKYNNKDKIDQKKINKIDYDILNNKD